MNDAPDRNPRFVRATRLPCALLGLGLALAACGKDPSDNNPASQGGSSGSGVGGTGGAGAHDGGGPGTPDAKPADPLNTSACKLLQAGPFVPVAGQTSFSVTAPPIMNDQQAYRIAIAKRNPAHVSFMVPTAGVHVIYTSTTAPLAVFTLDGTMIEVTNLRMSIPECPEVKGRHTVTLKAEGHIIRVGPDPAAASVDVVIAAGS